MKSMKYVDDLSKMTGVNDTQLAKLIGISQPNLSNLKAGRRIMENETCIAIALQLGIDPVKVIMAADMDRAERSGQQSLWEVFIQRMATPVSAILIGVAIAGVATEPSKAESNQRFEKVPLRQ